MEDAFEDRERSEEARFKMNEELAFKVQSRRNKLLGRWAAKQMGLTSTESEEFARAVVIADLEEPGSGDVVRMVERAMKERGLHVTAQEVEDRIKALDPVAKQQVTEEFPEALGRDHARVGDVDY